MVETRITVTNKIGLHARPAALFVQTANKFLSEITVKNLWGNGQAVDAKSILMVLTLGVGQNNEILIRAEGPDEEEAIQSLGVLVRGNFGKKEGDD
jgi:phosphocarrier protein HPr